MNGLRLYALKHPQNRYLTSALHDDNGDYSISLLKITCGALAIAIIVLILAVVCLSGKIGDKGSINGDGFNGSRSGDSFV